MRSECREITLSCAHVTPVLVGPSDCGSFCFAFTCYMVQAPQHINYPVIETGWSRRETGVSSLSHQQFSENTTLCRNVKRNHPAKKSVQWQRLLKISVSLLAPNKRRSLRQATRLASEGLSWTFRWFNFLKVTLRNTRFDIQIFYIVTTWNLRVLYESQNKQKILHYATPKIGFYDRGGECLLRGTHKVLIRGLEL